jgi:hypothetical protein
VLALNTYPNGRDVNSIIFSLFLCLQFFYFLFSFFNKTKFSIIKKQIQFIEEINLKVMKNKQYFRNTYELK